MLPPHTAEKAKTFRQHFRGAGWKRIWTDMIYDYTHFHSNAHEVLGIAEGKVTLRLGGQSHAESDLEAGNLVPEHPGYE
jgi:uncharacterized protein YjlB